MSELRTILKELKYEDTNVNLAYEKILNLFKNSLELPSDEEIEKLFPIDNNWATEDKTHALGKRQGAKWMRDKIKKNVTL